ncbi:MAG TPA: S46 family peptidase [Polyangium sp.]|nr:S46 family peptidase [Polyangium sp.]
MRRLMTSSSTLALVAISALTTACSGEAPARPAAANPTATTPANTTSTAAGTPTVTKPRFMNPGGMWVPGQLATHQEPLKAAGFDLDPKVLTDPTAAPLDAVVSLGGCSASFVSADGLIVTNHHCVEGMLQFISPEGQNLGKTGYHAKTRADEKWVGPTSRVFITQSFKDVTSEIRADLDKLTSDRARFDKLEEREKNLVSSCEKGRPQIRCSVKSYFGGAQYLLIEQLELRDVRMVYAPPEGVGDFGGEIDNWRWPRHTGDFAFLRAYVGPDQKPADNAATNVPYKPRHYLPTASKPLAAGDFVLVAGYPGKTNRLDTALEVRERLEWDYPRRITALEQSIAALEALAKQQPKLEVKTQPKVGYFGNGLTKTRGLSEGLGKGGVAAQREKEDAALATWIDADPERKKRFGDVMSQMAKASAEKKKTREEDRAIEVISGSADMLSAALMIVRMAEERDKPDAARDPMFQERNWKRIEQRLARMTKSYDRAIDHALLGLSLERLAKLPDADRPAFVSTILGKKLDRASIDKTLVDLYDKTKLEDEKTRIKLFQTAKKADLAKSSDALIRLAVTLKPIVDAAENREKAYVGTMSLLHPRYFEALQLMRGSVLAPDANGTLRVTYGTVRGYRPKPEAPEYRPFTTLSEMVAKVTDKEPFAVPAKFVEAARAKKFGKYVSAELGEVPADFLSDLDITGGNSGSPTINAKGELVGLAFDGNYESMASDVVFLPEITRTIHVDFRYVQWILDVDGADNVLTELGVTPSID